MSAAMMPNGTERPANAHDEMTTSMPRFRTLLKPAERDVVQADDRNAVEILEPRAQRNELQQVWHDVHFDGFAIGGLDNAEHLHVLFQRKRDVDVIDVLLADDLVGLVQRAEQRQAAIADVIAGRAVVEEADDLESQLAMLEDLVGDQLSEIAGAGNQHALQTDAGLPSPFERLAHELARRIGENDVDDQVERPDELRDLVHAEVLQRIGHVVGVVVQRAADAEDDGENAADEHGEEVVDARSPAAQVIDTLDVKRERQDRHHERQKLAVVLQTAEIPW